MAITGGIMLGVGALVGAGAAVVGTVNTINNAKDMRKRSDDASAKQDKMIADAEAKERAQAQSEKTMNEANLNRDQAKSRQDKLAKRGQSYRDTILTSPLGVPSDNASSSGSQKTLLGM